MYQFRALQPSASRRRYLFLQGPASPFFRRLADVLVARGHDVFRINFNFGDRQIWSRPAQNYSGRPEDWQTFLGKYLLDNSVTDIILFGDCRFYHRIAGEVAAKQGIVVHVCEEGYFRPSWITVEVGGVNGFSSLPRDPDLILREAQDLPPVKDIPWPATGIVRRAYWDVLYNIATVFGRPLYPHYRRHRPWHPFVEYGGWIGRLLHRRRDQKHAEAECRRLFAHPGGFYLVPLQLDGDFQIRQHSAFGSNGPFLREVISSFARSAPREAHLLFKNHPLDNGLTDRKSQVRSIAAEFGVADRVTCIDGGALPAMLDACRGVVLVNSTSGTSALIHERPTIALGHAIFNIPGLTFQGKLDDFWVNGQKPDMALFKAFRRLVIHRTQVNGSFFSPEGIAMAVEAVATRVGAAPVQPVITFARAGEADEEKFSEAVLPLYAEAERDHAHIARSVGSSTVQSSTS